LAVNLAAFDLKAIKLVSNPPADDVSSDNGRNHEKEKSEYFKPDF